MEARSARGIEARALVKDFPGVRALDGLDLHVERGELYGLVGPNGSGKTTLIRILLGLDHATAGRVAIFGRRPGEVRGVVGYMPQEEALYPDLSILENVLFFAGLYGEASRERARDVLRLVHLNKQRSRIVSTLSGGMRRRVSLAAALVHDPTAIFLDEPTAGVDPLLRNEFWDSFHERAEAGASLLITTHHMEEARRCDRLGLLWNGRLLREGAPDALLDEAGADSLDEAFAVFAAQEEEEHRR